ncbi:MAG: PH domain-containing protein [Chloracidobacterium sp.]|nr:PH domain-containing protein [Chloracidobacterium sp.]
MYCEKCGADNSETAVFCRKCGVAMAEMETRVAARSAMADVPQSRVQSPMSNVQNSSAIEREVFAIAPTMKFVKAGYIGAAVAAILLVGIVSALLSSYVPIWVAVILGLLLFLVPGFYHLKQKFLRYTLTETKLEIDSGFISRNTRNVPLRRVQDVTVSATPWQRLLGIGDLVIDNASDDGGKTMLKNIDTPKRYADELLEQMRRLER